MIPQILPSQYLCGSSARLDPYKRLMAAVLQTAVDDRWGSIHRRVPRQWTHDEIQGVRRATAYVASTDRAWPFSFENLCEALGIEASVLRQQLEKEPRT
jgi:hypothetical protein